jgi:16S rRNA (cytosine1402-N4)-methyltransferase
VTDYHAPVLPREVLEALRPQPGKRFVDGTLGGGGHTASLLETGAEVIGIDRDPEALAAATARCASFGSPFRALHGNFAEIASLVSGAGWEEVDGVLLDIGVSSHQLDDASRGFSFQGTGPLDMRMDPSGGFNAADVVNTYPEDALKQILREFGEETFAGRIARAIVEERQKRPLTTTRDLASLVERVYPGHSKRHPATRTFQAIRMEVNAELASLERGLEGATHLLRPGGRLAVITFHSLEDRIVKNFIRNRSQRWIDRPEWPAPRPNPDFQFEPIGRKPVEAGDDEVRTNPRSRSAKLRWAERHADSARRA